MNSYLIVDINRRAELDKKWIIKYYVLNPNTIKDIEYYYVLTSSI
jgi:hypothetical protein